MDNTLTKRIIWLDLAKFAVMFLVIFEHVITLFNLNDTTYIGNLRNIIVTFHMPLFFMLSGFLYYKATTKAKDYSKLLYGLLVPYLIYQFIFLPFCFGKYLTYIDLPPLTILKKCIIGILLGDNLPREGSQYALSVCIPCWFIMVIMQLRLIFLNINLNRNIIITLCLSSFIILNFLNASNIDLYFCIDNTLYAIPYFLIGYSLKLYRNNIGNNNFEKLLKKNIFAIVSLLLFAIVYSFYCQHHNLLFLRYLCGFIGSFIVIIFSLIISKTNKFIDIISRNTLFIIFFHALLLFFIKWFGIYKAVNLCQGTVQLFLCTSIFSIIIYIICYYTIAFLEKSRYGNIILGKYKPIVNQSKREISNEK